MHIRTCTQIHVKTHTYINMHAHTHTQAYTHVHMTCTHIYTHAHSQAYIHMTCTHTQTQGSGNIAGEKMEGMSQRMGAVRQRCVLGETATARIWTQHSRPSAHALHMMGLSDIVHLSGMEERALKPHPFLWDQSGWACHSHQ